MAKQYRNEWKYVLPEAMLCSLEQKLKSALKTDTHGDEEGKYEIHSLYFDDVFDRLAKENDEGNSHRYKWRIRYYGNDTDFIRLERKEKYNGRCHKDSAKISKDQFELIMNNDWSELMWTGEDKLIKRFAALGMEKGIRPKAIVDYERVAFVEPISNVRITLDRNISVSGNVDNFLKGDYLKIPLQEKNRHVLEVKFDYILPSYVRHMITDDGLTQTTYSKYYNGRLELQKEY